MKIRSPLPKYLGISAIGLYALWMHAIYGQQYYFQKIGLEEGLPQSAVLRIAQDPFGFLWFATDAGGIARYNGREFKVWDTKNGLPSNVINDIAFDSTGNVYVGTRQQGLAMLNKNTLIHFNVSSGMISNHIHRLLYYQPKNLLVIVHPDRISSFDQKIFHDIDKNFFRKHNIAINDALLTQNGVIVLSTSSGLVTYNLETKNIQLIDSLNGTALGNIKKVVQDQHKNLFLLNAKNEIWVMPSFNGHISESNRLLPFNKIKISPDITIETIDITADNELWIGTNKNLLIKITGNKVYRFSHNNGFKGIVTKSVFKDSFGITWIACPGEGLYKFYSTAFFSFPFVNGEVVNDIFFITEWNNEIYVSSFYRGILKISDSILTPFLQSKELINPRNMAFDSSGTLWIATANGLFSYKKGKLKKYGSAEGIPAVNTRYVFIDRENTIWVGSGGEGLFFKKENQSQFSRWQGNVNFSQYHVHKIYQDTKGVLWIGTNVGPFKKAGDSFISLFDAQYFCDSYTGDITEDKFGNIYFATGGCIIKYNGVDFQRINYQSGLSSGTIYFIGNDKEGNLWVGGNLGVDRIEFSSYGDIRKITLFGKYEGFPGIEANSRAIYCDTHGNMYFGCVGGLIKLNAQEPLFTASPPITYLTEIQKNFLPLPETPENKMITSRWVISPSSPIEFSREKSHITFLFESIHTSLAHKIQYSFKLDGFDKDYSPYKNDPAISYSNLPPGTYKLYYRTYIPDQQIFSEPRYISFTIHAPFWENDWFYLFLALVLVGLLLLYDKYRNEQKRKQQQILEEYARKQNEQILKQNEEIKTLLSEVHHRVKNNLQIIISLLNIQMNYVKDEEVLKLLQESSSRIRSMSLLHEKLYKNKNFNKIQIDEYINDLVDTLIQNYSLNITVHQKIQLLPINIDIDTLIPLGLIITELVTNSITHGFKGRTEGIIEMTMQENPPDNPLRYTLIIKDNGVGFDPKIFEDGQCSMGIELVKLLIHQIQGEIKLVPALIGTEYHLKFFKL